MEQLERLEKWLNERYLRARRHFHERSEALVTSQSNAIAAQVRFSF